LRGGSGVLLSRERNLIMRNPSRIVLGLAVVFACGTASAPASDAKVDVTGTWKLEVDLGGNTGSPEFTFTQKGEKLTGKYKGQLGEADVTGTVKGNKIEFSFSIGDMGKAVYTGTVDKDGMKGKAEYGDQLSGTFTGKKEKKDK
jgi:hypothetical protein